MKGNSADAEATPPRIANIRCDILKTAFCLNPFENNLCLNGGK